MTGGWKNVAGSEVGVVILVGERERERERENTTSNVNIGRGRERERDKFMGMVGEIEKREESVEVGIPVRYC